MVWPVADHVLKQIVSRKQSSQEGLVSVVKCWLTLVVQRDFCISKGPEEEIHVSVLERYRDFALVTKCSQGIAYRVVSRANYVVLNGQ